LCDAIAKTVHRTLSQQRDGHALADDVFDMRQRLAREKPSSDPWDVKQVRGGLVDLEFICQYLQLRYAHADPAILDTNTVGAFRNLGKAGFIDDETAGELIKATKLLTNLQAMLRISTAGAYKSADAPAGLKTALTKSTGARDYDDLEHRLRETQIRVMKYFDAIIGSAVSETADAEA